jgi:hypothetical protein
VEDIRRAGEASKRGKSWFDVLRRTLSKYKFEGLCGLGAIFVLVLVLVIAKKLMGPLRQPAARE